MDETVDVLNRKIVNVIISPIQESLSFRLFYCAPIETSNAEKIIEVIVECLNKISCSTTNFAYLISDNAPYMISAGKRLKQIYNR